MGVVYKARQPQLDRLVALKILSHDLASDPAFAERFNREARVLARLSHPHIVGIFDFGTAGPYCYFLMEYVDGVNLRQAMQAGRFAPAESLAMVEEICSALKFAHEEGILHRDIKPENVLIDSKGRVKIADFGIAKLVGEGELADVTLTMQGSVLGSPHYMAPEQIETPGDVDQRADIYSLGVVFYELLTGELPIGRFALPSEKGEMDARIDAIVMRTLEKERHARFQTADEMQTQVKTVATSPAPPVSTGASTPIAHDATNARFSGASAILTGISLPLAIIVPVAVRYVGSAVSVGAILATLCTAVIGFLLGARALCEIRSSGGTKGGLGSALFGVTAWPILLLFIIALFSGPAVGLSWGSNMILPIPALTTLVTGMMLVWSLRRWTLGVTRKNGLRSHPGFGRALALILLLAVGGPILISQTMMGFVTPRGSLSNRIDPFGDKSRNAITRYNEDDIDWRLGEAELSLPLRVLSDVRAEFFLVLKDGQGKPIKYSRIGVWEEQKGPQTREDFIVKIGTLGSKVEDPDSAGGFAGHLSLTGESGEIHGVSDIEKWSLEASEVELKLYGGSSSYSWGIFNPGASVRVGERNEMIDGTSTLTGILELEVRSSRIR
jgi:serine/threonine protein kinase